MTLDSECYAGCHLCWMFL